MTYSVKEIFYTLQGEGARTGRAAVFCRFAGCNLWSGREQDRGKAACRFCDTDFRGTDGPGGGKYPDPEALADKIRATWPDAGGRTARHYVVCTGGEPLLQLDEPLVDALHARDFEVAIETNGTCAAPPGVDWICVSPKGVTPLRVVAGHELKLVYPQRDAPPERFADLAFEHFFLQPLDGPELAENTEHCVAYCKAHPHWRLSLQTHKLLGIP
jgi:7-carboxy-7-deazaguanine synthase (Cx14CxxC type)